MSDTHRVWYLRDKEGYTDCVLFDADKFMDHMASQNCPVAVMELDKLEQKDEQFIEEWIDISRRVLTVTESYIKGEDTYSTKDIKKLTEEIDRYAQEAEKNAMDKRN